MNIDQFKRNIHDEYLSCCGLGEYDDAIDTPFHLKRKQRLAAGYDDYTDYYPRNPGTGTG